MLLEPFHVSAGWVLPVRQYLGPGRKTTIKQMRPNIWDGALKSWQWHWIQRLMWWGVLWSTDNSILEPSTPEAVLAPARRFMPSRSKQPGFLFQSYSAPAQFNTLSDSLTFLGPWPKPHPSSFLLSLSKHFAGALLTGIWNTTSLLQVTDCFNVFWISHD